MFVLTLTFVCEMVLLMNLKYTFVSSRKRDDDKRANIIDALVPNFKKNGEQN